MFRDTSTPGFTFNFKTGLEVFTSKVIIFTNVLLVSFLFRDAVTASIAAFSNVAVGFDVVAVDGAIVLRKKSVIF